MSYLQTEEGAAHLAAFLDTIGTSSRRVYKSEVSQFFKGFAGDPAAIAEADLQEWKDRMGPGTAAKTLKRKVSVLNRFFSFLEGRMDGFQNPFGQERGTQKAFREGDYPESEAFQKDLAKWTGRFPAESTRRTYRNHVSLFFRWVNKSPGDVTAEDAEAYRDHLRKEGLKPSTLWARFIAVNGFFRFLADRDGRFTPPMDFKALNLEVPDPQRGYYDILRTEEVKRLLKAPDRRTLKGKRDYLILRLLLVYGLRVGEAAKLRWRDADAERHKGKLRLWIRDRKGRKGRRETTPIILEGAELKAWDDWVKSSGIHWEPDTPIIAPLRHDMRVGGLVVDYARLRKNKPRSSEALRNLLAGYMQAAGIDAGERHLSPHALRHTCFTFLARAGVNVVDIQKLAAHKSLSTTSIYTHAAQDFDDHVGMKNPLAKM